jgi:hypothetical protein
MTVSPRWMEFAGAHGHVQRQRNGRGRRVAVFVDGDDHLVQRQLQLLGRAVHDADVRLVRDQPVDVGLGAAGFLEHRAGHVSSTPTASLNTAWPSIFRKGRPAPGRSRRNPGVHRMSTWRAIGMQLGGKDARGVAGFQHHGAGAVAEQHAGGAVLEIEDAREHFGTDDQRLARGAGADHRIGHRQRVDETRADGLHVEGRAAVRRPACAATMQAVDGKTMSGVDVATMMRSISAASTPAASRPPARPTARSLHGTDRARRSGAPGCRCARRSSRQRSRRRRPRVGGEVGRCSRVSAAGSCQCR